jgi:Spy/CpxP family protein refolding chaperone
MQQGLIKFVLIIFSCLICSSVLARDNQSGIDQISQELGLSNEQRTKVEEIFNAEKKKVEAVFAEEQKKLKKIQEETRTSLQAVLSPEQMNQLESKMRQKK